MDKFDTSGLISFLTLGDMLMIILLKREEIFRNYTFLKIPRQRINLFLNLMGLIV